MENLLTELRGVPDRLRVKRESKSRLKAGIVEFEHQALKATCRRAALIHKRTV